MIQFLRSLNMLILLSLITGVAYPGLITIVARLVFSNKSSGDFILVKDKKVGARLIAQKFENDSYFWPRPSAGDYNPLSSGGSNLGPTNLKLKNTIGERKTIIQTRHENSDIIPSELLYASGSGLDPHISKDTAYFQAARVAQARRIEISTVKGLIEKHAENGLINVLMLNVALDGI